MKESMNTQRPPTPPAPQSTPQHYLQPPPLVIFQNPIPYQGVMNTQQEINSAPPQMGQYQNSGPNPVDRNILHIREEEILLQTHDRQYNMPPDSTPTTSEKTPATIEQPFMIPHPNIEPNPRIPCIPLRRNVHKPHARTTHNYSLVNDLAQSPATMFVLEVFQTYSSQRKSFLFALGAVNPAYTQLITIDLDSVEPCLPAMVAFQIPINI
jgi:hypothetical protein